MVATRRGTRVEPREEGETGSAEPTPEEVISSPSQMRTRRSAIIRGQIGENGTNESKSAVTSRSPPGIHSTQITTRSRHRSGQSDISEAESTASNNLRRRSYNTQSLEQLPDSTRELRSRRITLITKPIVESKEDAELSDAQSNCSSVLITPRRKQSETTTGSVPTRSQSSLLVSEPTFDVTDAESDFTHVSGVRSIATRSTRSSRARRPSSPVREPEKEQTSDAESCSSGISIQPLAKRSSRRNKSNLQSDEVPLVKESNKDDYSEQDTSKKQSPKKHGVKSDAQSLVGEQNVLSSRRRSLRSRSAIKKDVAVVSDDGAESSSSTINKVLDLEEAKVEESSVTKDADLAVEASSVPAVQSSETQPAENIIADQVLQPSEDEEPAVEKSIAANDDATEETNESVQDVQRSANMSGSATLCLFVDSSDSEESQHCEDEEDENHMQVEEVESAQVIDELRSKKASTNKIQDASEDGLIVIDKVAEVDASKKDIHEHDDDKNDAGEEGETLVSDEDDDIIELEEEVVDKDETGGKGASSGSDDYEEDENNIKVKKDGDELVDKCKSKKTTKLLQDVSSDGLFVIDKSPGVNSNKKYLLEPEDDEVDEKGESSGSDDDGDEEHENDMEVEEEEEDDDEQVVDKCKSKKAKKMQIQDVSGDGLFVIDKAAGLDASKKYFLEHDDENDAGEKGKTLVSDEEEQEDETIIELEEEHVDDEVQAEEGESSVSDKDDDDAVEEDDNEQVVDKRKSKKASKQRQDVVDERKSKKASKQRQDVVDERKSKKATKQRQDVVDERKSKKASKQQRQNVDEHKFKKASNQRQDVVDERKSKKASKQQRHNVSGGGLFVMDKVPGVDCSKKYFLEPEDEDDEADEKGESSGLDKDDDEEHENRMEVEEEEDDSKQVVHKRKSKKASKQQLQDVSGDGLFVIDKAAGLDSSKKYFLEPEDDEDVVDEKEGTPEQDDDDDFIDEDEQEDEEETLINRPKRGFALSTSIDTGISLKEMGGLYINFDAGKPNPGPSLLSKLKKESKKKDELLQKSVITPDFEKKESVPPYLESLNQQKKFRKEQRDKTTGRGWFDMKAPELTEELKNDLKALKMRSAMDPKHFYKKNDRQGFPKYFEVGTVVDNPIDYYHSRIPKKERKRTMVDELLADSELRRYNKKKFKEIMAEKAARAEGKKNKKKKKFRT